MALSDHFGATPSAICGAILSELSRFQFVAGGAGAAGGSGCVKTIKRIAGDELRPENIDRQLTAGLPAMLVAHLLGPFVGEGRKCRRSWDQTIRVAVVCCAGRFSSQADRLAGETPDVNPGVEDLLDWATYYAMRAIEQLAGCREQRPVEQLWLRLEPGKYMARVDIECRRTIDVWSDGPATTLESLGLVHSPLDLGDLWESDNTTPKSEWPPTVDGGVTVL